ncbi:MAG: hypothetical protein DRP65_08830 [Planctomycetota bacterium]|nr:MAG: hypothetical protein DRP65_08830 [Planctomycetota bacterium]
MKLGHKTSLGIDICEDRISAALLRQHGSGIKLVKTATADVPKGAITNGNITDPAALGAAIRQMLAKNQIRRQPAAVTLVAKPVLTQIIDLPDDMPDNLNQFISAEIKHSSVFTGKEPYYDSHGLNKLTPESPARVFVAATSLDKVSMLLKTMSLAGIETDSIELDIIAAIRALNERRIANAYDHNLLFALIRGSVMTLCVFRKGQFDYIRYIDLANELNDPDKSIARCETEFSAIIQFYDIEVESAANTKWEFAVAIDWAAIEPQDLEFSLQKKYGVEAHVCSGSTLCDDTVLEQADAENQASITAAGLAMKRFVPDGSQIKIDLLPDEVKEIKLSKRLMLITANVVAAILLLMIIIAGVVRIKLSKIAPSGPEARQIDPITNMELLLKRKNVIDAKITELSTKRDKISEIFEGDNTGNWAGILDDIRRRTPITLCITRLSCPGALSLEIDGQSLSYRSVHLFADLLGQSEFVDSATVASTNRNRRVEGLISYSINCILTDNRGLPADVEG